MAFLRRRPPLDRAGAGVVNAGMTRAFINRIGTATPEHEVHGKFVDYAPSLLADERARRLFQRMVDRADIERRYSVLDPDPAPELLDRGGFYRRGAFPDTARRMALFKESAFPLARAALGDLGIADASDCISHVIVTCCTGFYAPGLDLEIVSHLGLPPTVERTMVGFMGCQAAVNALKLARHIVRSDGDARVLVINLELCTLHLHETDDLEQVLSFLLFADGCAASLVSAEPTGLELKSFRTAVLPEGADQITWHIGCQGFDMVLSGRVPATIARGLPPALPAILGGRSPAEVAHWAVHPGGRSILDSVERAAGLGDGALAASRDILRRYGNMSSATVMFVLKEILASRRAPGPGCAIAFGPGLTAETLLFDKAA
jgi:predicted naringenin-chalcone synthase